MSEDIEKLQRHIDSLKKVHEDLDKQVREEYIRYGDDALVKTLKKKKLSLKDEIEGYERNLASMG